MAGRHSNITNSGSATFSEQRVLSGTRFWSGFPWQTQLLALSAWAMINQMIFEDCAVLATDAADSTTLKKVEFLLKPQEWTGIYAKPQDDTSTGDKSHIYKYIGDIPVGNSSKDAISEGVPRFPEFKTLYGLLSFSAKTYGTRLYLGERSKIPNNDGTITRGKYLFYTYADTKRLVEAIGRALDIEVNVPVSYFPGSETSALRILGVWSKTRMHWRLIDFAANFRGIVTVPLYDTLGEESVEHIIKTTEMKVIACEGDKLEAVLKLREHGADLQAVISFDEVTANQQAMYSAAGISLYHMDTIRRKYMSIKDNKTPEQLPNNLTDVATIIFTSGTTGPPKGVVHTNGSLISMVSSYLNSSNRMRVKIGDSTLSYLPLAHVYQRGVELVVTALGVAIGYYSGELLKVTEDLQLLNPTIFVGVPRVFTKILAKIKAGVAEKPAWMRWIVGKALNYKKWRYSSSAAKMSSIMPDLLFKKIRQTFGGRLRTLSMGSAPMESEQLKELQLYLSAAICEGWGMTETGIAFLQDALDGEKGTIGGPLSGWEYRVSSMPELQYNAVEDPPRGELLVRGPGMMTGYFLDELQTRKVIDKDGWLKTGDVVEILPSGAAKIIDRAKNIFKLSQGEYVAPERLENIYINCEFVEQIYVHGDSLQAELVAVVVPVEAQVRKWADENAMGNKSYKALLSEKELKQQILDCLAAVGKDKVKGFEIIKAVHLVSEPFSVDNGLTTPTMKIIRSVASERFREQISNMYVILASKATA